MKTCYSSNGAGSKLMLQNTQTVPPSVECMVHFPSVQSVGQIDTLLIVDNWLESINFQCERQISELCVEILGSYNLG